MAQCGRLYPVVGACALCAPFLWIGCAFAPSPASLERGKANTAARGEVTLAAVTVSASMPAALATCAAVAMFAVGMTRRGIASGAMRPKSIRVHRRSVSSPSAANQFGSRDDLTRMTDAASWLQGIDIFIFDCDGVIWRGDSAIPGAAATLDKLRAAGKKCFFVTNNSTKSRQGYKKKFDSLGLPAAAEEIFSSSFAAAAYMEQSKFKATGKKVYIIGEKGISEELDQIGVPWLGAEADADKEPFMGPGGKVEVDPNVGAVIVGFDRNINYYKIQYAQLCINEQGAKFIATNLDKVTHLTDAQEWAGNGSMANAIKGCTGQEPILVGKPSPLMIEYLADKYGLKDRKKICMVGDRLDTDIAFGRDNGLQTCLVLSGVTTEAKVMDQDNPFIPDTFVDDINSFVP